MPANVTLTIRISPALDARMRSRPVLNGDTITDFVTAAIEDKVRHLEEIRRVNAEAKAAQQVKP